MSSCEELAAFSSRLLEDGAGEDAPADLALDLDLAETGLCGELLELPAGLGLSEALCGDVMEQLQVAVAAPCDTFWNISGRPL